MSEHSDILEKAAGIIREKGRMDGELWHQEIPGVYHYIEGPVCAIGALSIASGTHDSLTDLYGVYQHLADSEVFDAAAEQSPVEHGNSSVYKIYAYNDRQQTTAEDIAQMFERAAKNV